MKTHCSVRRDKSTTRNDICPSCEHLMNWGPVKVTVAGNTRISVSTWHCRCGEVVIRGEALAAWNAEYKRVRGLTP